MGPARAPRVTSPFRRPAVLWLCIVIALTILVVASLAVGSVSLAPGDVVRALAGRGDEMAITIVRELRLPRVALALLVGCALGSSGAALQGTLRNALAEPCSFLRGSCKVDAAHPG